MKTRSAVANDRPRHARRKPRDGVMDDHIQRDVVLELPYLIDGRRVFVAVDDKGWRIADATASSETEAQRVIHRLNDALEAHQQRPRLALVH